MAGFGNDGRSGFEGCRVGRALGTYLHGPLLPRNPQLSDWLLSQSLAHLTGGPPQPLPPLDDKLEAVAHAVSAGRARERAAGPKPSGQSRTQAAERGSVDDPVDTKRESGLPAGRGEPPHVVGSHDHARPRHAPTGDRQPAQVADVPAALPREGAAAQGAQRAPR